jgi:hypothetical protein
VVEAQSRGQGHAVGHRPLVLQVRAEEAALAVRDRGRQIAEAAARGSRNRRVGPEVEVRIGLRVVRLLDAEGQSAQQPVPGQVAAPDPLGAPAARAQALVEEDAAVGVRLAEDGHVTAGGLDGKARGVDLEDVADLVLGERQPRLERAVAGVGALPGQIDVGLPRGQAVLLAERVGPAHEAVPAVAAAAQAEAPLAEGQPVGGLDRPVAVGGRPRGQRDGKHSLGGAIGIGHGLRIRRQVRPGPVAVEEAHESRYLEPLVQGPRADRVVLGAERAPAREQLRAHEVVDRLKDDADHAGQGAVAVQGGGGAAQQLDLLDVVGGKVEVQRAGSPQDTLVQSISVQQHEDVLGDPPGEPRGHAAQRDLRAAEPVDRDVDARQQAQRVLEGPGPELADVVALQQGDGARRALDGFRKARGDRDRGFGRGQELLEAQLFEVLEEAHLHELAAAHLVAGRLRLGRACVGGRADEKARKDDEPGCGSPWRSRHAFPQC